MVKAVLLYVSKLLFTLKRLKILFLQLKIYLKKRKKSQLWIKSLEWKEFHHDFIQTNMHDNPVYVGDLIPSVSTYQKAINIYKKGLNTGDFYEEPIGDDPFGYFYPDW